MKVFFNYLGRGETTVVQTPEGTKVRAKVGGDTDVGMLKKRLQQQEGNEK